MKKLLFIALALLLMSGQVVCFADIQIDSGMSKNQNAIKFFIGRNGRETIISADRVVVWDSTSKDGISIVRTTTSADPLVAGVTLDEIPGASTDNSTTDMSRNNWGRVQTWGLHNNVLLQAGSKLTAGSVVISSSASGAVGDNLNNGSSLLSGDGTMVGVALETQSLSGSAGNVDIMVKVD